MYQSAYRGGIALARRFSRYLVLSPIVIDKGVIPRSTTHFFRNPDSYIAALPSRSLATKIEELQIAQSTQHLLIGTILQRGIIDHGFSNTSAARAMTRLEALSQQQSLIHTPDSTLKAISEGTFLDAPAPTDGDDEVTCDAKGKGTKEGHHKQSEGLQSVLNPQYRVESQISYRREKYEDQLHTQSTYPMRFASRILNYKIPTPYSDSFTLTPHMLQRAKYLTSQKFSPFWSATEFHHVMRRRVNVCNPVQRRGIAMVSSASLVSSALGTRQNIACGLGESISGAIAKYFIKQFTQNLTVRAPYKIRYLATDALNNLLKKFSSSDDNFRYIPRHLNIMPDLLIKSSINIRYARSGFHEIRIISPPDSGKFLLACGYFLQREQDSLSISQDRSADKYAKRQLGTDVNLPVSTMLWIDASDPNYFWTQYREIARRLGMSLSTWKFSSDIQISSYVRSELEKSKRFGWTLVVTNLDNKNYYDALPKPSDQNHGQLFITTSKSLWSDDESPEIEYRIHTEYLSRRMDKIFTSGSIMQWLRQNVGKDMVYPDALLPQIIRSLVNTPVMLYLFSLQYKGSRLYPAILNSK